MSIVTTAITALDWSKLDFDFSKDYPRIYYNGREIKKISNIEIHRCEVIIEHALLEETYDILNGGEK